MANRRCSRVLQGLARLLRLISDMGHRIAGLYGNSFSYCCTSSSATNNAALVMPSTPRLFHIKLLIKAAVQRLQRRRPGIKLQLGFLTSASRGVDEHATETSVGCWFSYPSGSCTVTGPPFRTPTLAREQSVSGEPPLRSHLPSTAGFNWLNPDHRPLSPTRALYYEFQPPKNGAQCC